MAGMSDESCIRNSSVTVEKYTVPGPEMTAFNGALEALCEHRGQPRVALEVLGEIVMLYNQVDTAAKRLENVCTTLLSSRLQSEKKKREGF